MGVKLDTLTQVALLGTARQSLPAVPSGSTLGELLTKVDATQQEQALLQMAALCGQHERAGAMPLKNSTRDSVSCPVETMPRVESLAGGHLLTMLAGEKKELLSEWLVLCSRAKRIVPPESLPQLLTLGKTKAELRDPILTVLGERGRWLAGQQPDWNWISGETLDESIWQTGEAAARLLLLQKLRGTDPAHARELLTSTWVEEEPDERADFIAVLAENLGPDDEPFLEAALNDKRKEVRRKAVDLMSLLPESAFTKRMQERVQPLLKLIPAEAGSILKLKKSKKATLELTLPAECTKAMRLDGVEPKPPTGIGEKMWWLKQMLKCVPLNFIENILDAGPADILEATLNSEWSKHLLDVWCDAAIRQRNQSWCMALADTTLAEAEIDDWTKLLLTLPPKERDEKLAVMFTDRSLKSRIYQVIEDLLNNGREEWSATFSQQVIEWLKRESSSVASEPGMWSFQQRMAQTALYLSPKTLYTALQGWPTTTKGWEFWQNSVERLQTMVQFRLEMREAIVGKE